LPIAAILWDFGDTLADERWMWAPMPDAPDWTDVYRNHIASGDLGSLWNIGAIDSLGVATRLAELTGQTVERVRFHMRECCRHLQFYEGVMAYAGASGLPQAIVTVNCDLFSEVVVPQYRLHIRFDAIVASWQARTEDKAVLCEHALDRLGVRAPIEHCLLIDNREDNLAAWRAKGGAAYHFRGEAKFLQDIDGIVGDAPRGRT